MVTPLFGLEFNRINGFNYQETGTRTQNLRIANKSKNQLEAIIGARITGLHTMNIQTNNVSFVPELHGNVRYNMLNTKLNVDIRQNGVAGPALIPRAGKQSRLVYNIGGGITAMHNDRWEYAIGYDARFADKYIAHQGTLKLRANF
jgi:hypothetical protein